MKKWPSHFYLSSGIVAYVLMFINTTYAYIARHDKLNFNVLNRVAAFSVTHILKDIHRIFH